MEIQKGTKEALENNVKALEQLKTQDPEDFCSRLQDQEDRKSRKNLFTLGQCVKQKNQILKEQS